jgi:hypothetical protein
MKRDIVTLSAITALGLALLPTGVAAQQQTLRQQLVGTWEVVSLSPGGATAQIVGANPKGYIILAGSGKYNVVLRKADRPKTNDRAEGMAASFGAWSVNEAD